MTIDMTFIFDFSRRYLILPLWLLFVQQCGITVLNLFPVLTKPKDFSKLIRYDSLRNEIWFGAHLLGDCYSCGLAHKSIRF